MNCKQANSVDMIGFLAACGYQPVRIRRADYWYHSPLHKESTPSFKVNVSKNTWYDFGLGKGGTLIDFVCILYQVRVDQALVLIAGKNLTNWVQKFRQETDEKSNHPGLTILGVAQPISNPHLKTYLKARHILPAVYNAYCKEITYQVGSNRFSAIGFKNKMGGYELRSPKFKGSSSPKFVSWVDNGSKTVHVFEGFFDFLSWQSILHEKRFKKGAVSSNFLILNSLSFFTRSLLLMEKHQHIHLWLDNDRMGDECTRQLKQRTDDKLIDNRIVYKGYKDLNEWWCQKEQPQKISNKLRL